MTDNNIFKYDFANKSFKERASFIADYYNRQAKAITTSMYPIQFFVYHSRNKYLPSWPTDFEKEEFPNLSVLDIDGVYYGIKNVEVKNILIIYTF
jgi:hypothetical protein